MTFIKSILKKIYLYIEKVTRIQNIKIDYRAYV